VSEPALRELQLLVKAWQKAEYLAVEVYQMTESFPPHQRDGLTNQMQRASVSVAAN